LPETFQREQSSTVESNNDFHKAVYLVKFTVESDFRKNFQCEWGLRMHSVFKDV